MHPRRPALVLIAALGLSIPGGAHAQYAPVGSHHGGQPGAGGSSLGNVAEAVPLSFPAERDGLPVPVAVRFVGGAAVHAAGAGWTVPLSYVSISDDVTRRRPRYLDGIELAPAEVARRVTLVLGGTAEVMVDIGQQRFRPVLGDQRLELTELEDAFELLDGGGLRYRFEQLPDLRDGPFFLVEIRGSQRDEARVVLRYEVTPVDVSSPDTSTPRWESELALTSIEYDYESTGTCGKHLIDLEYRAEPAVAATKVHDGSSLLALEILDRAQLVRTRVLDSIAVMARPDGPCGGLVGVLPGAGGSLQLSRYDFRYEPDGDSSMPRLAAVDVVGRADTPEGSRAIPVARYHYGQATQTDGEPHLQMEFVGVLQLPTDQDGLGATKTLPLEDIGPARMTTTMLADFTGDGLPDYVSAAPGHPFTIAPNLGGDSFGSAESSAIGPEVLSAQTLVQSTYDHFTIGYEPTWIQSIDFNGDGRTDIIDARVVPGTWRVYLNEPGSGPGGITWHVVDLDVTALLGLAVERQLWTGDPAHLPVALSFTGHDLDVCHCYYYTQAGECAEPVPSAINENYTMVVWKLLDANGDGYPDLVSNTAPFEEQITDGATFPAVCPEWTDDWQWHPRNHRFDFAGPNSTVIFLNRSGARPVSGTLPFSDEVPWIEDSGCSVEYWTAEYQEVIPSAGPCGCDDEGVCDVCDDDLVCSQGECVLDYDFEGKVPAGSTQECGFADVNGDRLLDRIGGTVRLGGPSLTWTGVWFDLPGPQAVTWSNSGAICKGWEINTNGIRNRHVAGLVDLSGDGIADYVVDREHVRLGSGYGFGEIVRVEGPEPGNGRPYATVSEAIDDGCVDAKSYTISALFDLDGDGHLDHVSSFPGGTDTYRLVSAAGVLGGLDVGRIISTTNGYGGTHSYTYDNAKRHTETPHQVPHAEIVLASEKTTTSVFLGGIDGGTWLSPRYFAYGEPQRVFDWALDRWSFRGYQRTATVSGRATTGVESPGTALPPGESWRVGTMLVQDRHRSTDLTTNHERYALTGTLRDEYTRAGIISSNPWPLLAVDLTSDVLGDQFGSHHGHARTLWQTSKQALPGYAEAHDCTGATTPYSSGWIYFPDNDGNWERPCESHGFSIVKETARQRGGPMPDEGGVETRDAIVGFDVYGRPTMIRHDNDLHIASDDVCEEISYAVPLDSSVWRPLHAVRRIRLFLGIAADGYKPMKCTGTVRTVSVQRFTWDEFLADSVDEGRLSSAIAERRDVSSGALIDQRTTRLERDADGRIREIQAVGGATTRTTALSQFDHFGIVPSTITQSATGEASSFVVSRKVDPWSLEEQSVTDPNQRRERTTYDGYGRPRTASVLDPATGAEYLVAAWDYLGDTIVLPDGDDQHDLGGRRVRTRSFLERLPFDTTLSSGAPLAGEVWTTTHLDALGRSRFAELDRGADYATPLVVGEVKRNTQGQIEFIADAHDSGSEATYGTTFLYRPDGSLRCQIRGRGNQNGTPDADVTNPTVARFASCFEEGFVGHQRRLRSFGPEERQPGTAAYGAFDEVLLTATGQRVEQSRVAGSEVFERAQFTYDVLGNQTAMLRYPDPDALTGAVTWQWAFDSLGQPLRVTEPGMAEVRHEYNPFGARTYSRWTDGAAQRAVRNTYDGFGRLIRSAEYTGATEVVGTANTYVYDVGSGEPWHSETAYLKGRLSHAHSAAMNVYFGYDGEGAASSTVWVDAGGARVENYVDYRADGSPSEIGYALPDNGYVKERATYDYDSAGVLASVDWIDGTGKKTLFEALKIDELGRYEHAVYGNDVEETWSYRPDDRRELETWAFALPSGESTSFAYTEYDGQLRVRERIEESTIGAGRREMLRFEYDANNRLEHFAATALPSQTTVAEESYAYDPLGNLTRLIDGVAGQIRDFIPDTVDPDRMCRVNQFPVGTTPPGTGPCTYAFDVRGNATSADDGAGTRLLRYDGRQRVTRVSHLWGATTGAQYAYGPLGDVVSLDIIASDANDNRADRRYGALVERSGPTLAQAQYQRRVPGPFGPLAILTGPPSATQPAKYPRADGNGTRVVFDGAGNAAQEIDYAPFGSLRRNTAAPGEHGYWKYLFNEGDRLADFRMDQLGARMYEPTTGRFLQRDPLMLTGTSGRAHPYGFAWNDPITYADPSGLCTEGDPNCPQWTPPPEPIPGDEVTTHDIYFADEGSGPCCSHQAGYYGPEPPDPAADLWKPIDYPETTFETHVIGGGDITLSDGRELSTYEWWTPTVDTLIITDSYHSYAFSRDGVLLADLGQPGLRGEDPFLAGVGGHVLGRVATWVGKGIAKRLFGASAGTAVGGGAAGGTTVADASAPAIQVAPETYGPFFHQVNKGGTAIIMRDQQLMSTQARAIAGGGEAVRATPGPIPNTWSPGTLIEFRTFTPPLERRGAGWVYWPMPEGDMLPIIVNRVQIVLEY